MLAEPVLRIVASIVSGRPEKTSSPATVALVMVRSGQPSRSRPNHAKRCSPPPSLLEVCIELMAPPHVLGHPW